MKRVRSRRRIEREVLRECEVNMALSSFRDWVDQRAVATKIGRRQKRSHVREVIRSVPTRNLQESRESFRSMLTIIIVTMHSS